MARKLLHQFALIASIISAVKCSCLHATSHLQRRVTPNNTVAIPDFTYYGPKGPRHWHTLDTPVNILCKDGTRQSPVNIDSSIKPVTEHPKFHIINSGSFAFENLGTTVEVLAKGTAEFKNATFNLKQFHFHYPSEHRINNEAFALEMHMVHEAADGTGGITVFAVLFDVSEENTPLLAELSKEINEIDVPGTIMESGPLSLDTIVKHLETGKLRTYEGSLTTPPCKEGIQFVIAERPLPVNLASFIAMKKVLKFNSRGLQDWVGDGGH